MFKMVLKVLPPHYFLHHELCDEFPKVKRNIEYIQIYCLSKKALFILYFEYTMKIGHLLGHSVSIRAEGLQQNLITNVAVNQKLNLLM